MMKGRGEVIIRLVAEMYVHFYLCIMLEMQRLRGGG